MMDSGDAGANLHPEDDDDEELDGILRSNIREARRMQKTRENLVAQDEMEVRNCHV